MPLRGAGVGARAAAGGLGIGVGSLLFFGFLYADEGILNQWEDRMEALVRQLPPYQRVIGGIVILVCTRSR